MKLARLTLICVLPMAVCPAMAAEDALSRLPAIASVPQAEPIEPSAFSLTAYLEDAVEFDGIRSDLAVPVPDGTVPNWINYSFADLRGSDRIADGLQIFLSDRFNLIAQSDQNFPEAGTVRNDLREAYLEWRLLSGMIVDVGRVNLREGAGYAFNPTDFFKARAVVDVLSADPAVLRTDRLGTFMLRAEYFFHGGTVGIVYAPKLDDPKSLLATPSSFGLDTGRTNGADRIVVTADYALAQDFDPQLLLYHDSDQSSVGLNITRAVGEQATAYLEWAGGRRDRLVDRALRFGIETGTLPAFVPRLFGTDQGQRFGNELAVGVSYQTKDNVNLTLEYDYSEAGFSKSEWNDWFVYGRLPAYRGELWFIRDYARDQQDAILPHHMFLRVAWDDAFVKHLTLAGFAITNLGDGSVLGQAEADYQLSDTLWIALIVQSYTGSSHSEFGSIPTSSSVIFDVTYYI